MRVVLDTSVLVSALLNVHGAPAQVLGLVRQGILTLCADRRILEPTVHRLSDPDDEPVLDAAVHGRVDALVTAKTRHFPNDLRAAVRAVTPAELIALLQAGGPAGLPP